MSPNSPRIFSQDILYRVLLCYGFKEDDLTHMWTSCRGVSRDFKAAVERLFLDRHLRKTWIRFHTDYEFAFAHLNDKNPNLVIYRVSQHSIRDEAKELKLRELLMLARRKGMQIHKPRIAVQIRRYADDTLIPWLKFNPDTLEMEFDWKEMYSEFFRESKERSKRYCVVGVDMLANKGLDWAKYKINDALSITRLKLRSERIARHMSIMKGDDYWNDVDEEGFAELRKICEDAAYEEHFSDEDPNEDVHGYSDEEDF